MVFCFGVKHNIIFVKKKETNHINQIHFPSKKQMNTY